MSQNKPAFEGDAVELLDQLVRLAVNQRASDIHLEPKHDRLQVRIRVDGAMLETQAIAMTTGAQIISRIKVLGRMDIAERRLPQDGQLALWIDGERVHLRASTFPSSQGEKVVLRILSGGSLLAFNRLGLGVEGVIAHRYDDGIRHDLASARSGPDRIPGTHVDAAGALFHREQG